MKQEARGQRPVGGQLPPQGELVKVVDFGIATVVSNEDGSSSEKGPPARLTTPGMVLGTAEYMSPEQAQGLKTDLRVDQYALGCIMYEMLAGKVPFQGVTPAATMLKHLTEKPVPLTKVRPEIPPELDRLVLRAMATDPAQRFPSMQEVEQGLVTIFEKIRRRSTQSATLTLPRVVAPQRSRRPWQVALGAGLGLSLMGLISLLIFLHRSHSAVVVPIVPPPPLVKASRPLTVSWSIRTEPSGATVIRLADGKSLGKTPFKKDMPTGDGVTAVELRLDGYQPATLQLSNESDENPKRLHLQPVAMPKEKPSKKGKGKKHAAIRDNDDLEALK
jgi:serine/threonine protein kinase